MGKRRILYILSCLTPSYKVYAWANWNENKGVYNREEKSVIRIRRSDQSPTHYPYRSRLISPRHWIIRRRCTNEMDSKSHATKAMKTILIQLTNDYHYLWGRSTTPSCCVAASGWASQCYCGFWKYLWVKRFDSQSTTIPNTMVYSFVWITSLLFEYWSWHFKWYVIKDVLDIWSKISFWRFMPRRCYFRVLGSNLI